MSSILANYSLIHFPSTTRADFDEDYRKQRINLFNPVNSALLLFDLCGETLGRRSRCQFVKKIEVGVPTHSNQISDLKYFLF